MADADKDRRSRMAISTVHAPPKKGGAGGAFTWGSATDTSIDFDASKVQQPVKVITGGPVAQPTVAATPFTANIASAQQFPALGTRTVTAPMASSAWAARPPVVAAAGATPQPVTAGVPQPVTMAPTTMAPTTMAPTTVVQPMRPVVQPAAAISATTRTVASTMTQQTVQAPYPVSATSYPAPMPTYAAPVAAPRVIKEVAEKDRRSRMAYSTYHQAPKKGGAGGAYTWGSAGDVKDFDPTAVAVIESKVTTAPAVGQASPVAASPFTGNISSAQQFPSLGSGHAGTQPSAWAQAPASIKEPPVVTGSGGSASGSPALVPSPAPVLASPAGPVPVAEPAAVPAVPAMDSTEQKESKNCSIQ